VDRVVQDGIARAVSYETGSQQQAVFCLQADETINGVSPEQNHERRAAL
jgi:hypothetical protein